jgi:hypothetical protein
MLKNFTSLCKRYSRNRVYAIECLFIIMGITEKALIWPSIPKTEKVPVVLSALEVILTPRLAKKHLAQGYECFALSF